MACLTKQQLDYIACETARYLARPDEEDITLSEEKEFMFKNRDAESGQKGYVILRKNKSFADQLTEDNTIYEIRYDFNLNEDFSLPENCVLKFNGGSVSGAHMLVGNNTAIEAKETDVIFRGVTIGGMWKTTDIHISWFGDADDYYDICRNACNLSDASIQNNIYLDKNIAWNPTKNRDSLFVPASNTNLYLGNHTITTNVNTYSCPRVISISVPQKNINVYGGYIVGDLSDCDLTQVSGDPFGGGAIYIWGGKNVLISGTKIYDYRGDGIEITHNDKTSFGDFSLASENVVIENVTCDYCGRNGLSVGGSSRNVTIKNSFFTNTGQHNTGTADPGFGIDVEPSQNEKGYVSVYNLVIDGCSFDNNLHTDIEFEDPRDTKSVVLRNMKLSSLLIAGSYDMCEISNCVVNSLIVTVFGGLNPNSLPNVIQVNNCSFIEFRSPGEFNKFYDIYFNNCYFTSGTALTRAPFYSRQKHYVYFNSCVVYYPALEINGIFDLQQPEAVTGIKKGKYGNFFFNGCSIEANVRLGDLGGINRISNCFIKSPYQLEIDVYNGADIYYYINNYIEITAETSKIFDFSRKETTGVKNARVFDNYVFAPSLNYTNTVFTIASTNRDYMAIIQEGNKIYGMSDVSIGASCNAVSSTSKMAFHTVPPVKAADLSNVLGKVITGSEFILDSTHKPIYKCEITSGNYRFCESDGAKAGVVRSGTFASKPSSSDIYVGFQYFNTDTHKTIVYGGSDTWYNPDGTTANS